MTRHVCYHKPSTRSLGGLLKVVLSLSCPIVSGIVYLLLSHVSLSGSPCLVSYHQQTISRSRLSSTQVGKSFIPLRRAMSTADTAPAPGLPDYLASPNAVLGDTEVQWRYGRAPDYSKTRKVWAESKQSFSYCQSIYSHDRQHDSTHVACVACVKKCRARDGLPS